MGDIYLNSEERDGVLDQQQRVLVADTFNQRIQILKVTARETVKTPEPKALTPGFQIKLTPEKGIK